MLDNIPNIKNTDSNQFFLIAGPCAIEGRDMLFEIAEKLIAITDKYKIPFIFKASYKKANRSSLNSFTGIGDKLALSYLKEVKEHFKIPVITDIHSVAEASIAAKYVDVLQIPAFLCRQTELLVAAAKTGKTVNIKKGQFMSPESMQFAVEKIKDSGNSNIWLTERGSFFGYGDIIVDYRGIPTMKNYAPVIMDCTHSLQQPNQPSGVTGGRPDLIETIAKAGISTGVDGLFIETHPNPSLAKSDGANMLPLELLDPLLEKLSRLRKVVIDL